MDPLAALLALVLFSIVLALIRVTHDRNNPASLLDLVRDPRGGRRLSLARTGQLTALVVSTWGYVWLVLHDKLTEVYFLTYMATWSAVHVADLAVTTRARPAAPTPEAPTDVR